MRKLCKQLERFCFCLFCSVFSSMSKSHVHALTSYDRSLPMQLGFAGATFPFHLDLVENIKQSEKYASSQHIANGRHGCDQWNLHKNGCF